MGFRWTTAVKKVRAMVARKKVIQGGTSAGKTWVILAVLIDTAIKNKSLTISVVSESIPHLRRGALKDFKKIMMSSGRWIDSHYNKSLLTYTFSSGSVIEFFSAKDESTQRGARRDILYMNEANNIPFEAYHQIAIRTEGEIYLDFNPSAEFWAHTEVLQETNSELLVLTYLDNESLPANVLEEFGEAMKKADAGSSYWINWVKVYIHGRIGSLQGVIFENWKTTKEIPKEAKLMGIGLDFGYTHPAAAIALWEVDGVPIFDEVLYEAGQNNSYILKKVKEYAEKHKEDFAFIDIFADGSRPEHIAELDELGLNIEPANKTAGSVFFGLQLMQEKEFLVTEESVNYIKELRGYKWATSKTGVKKEAPVKEEDDACDAARYIYEAVYNNKYSGVYNITKI